MNIDERNKKVEDNLKLVSYALNLLKVPWNEDYFQQGVIELIRCVDNFDNKKGYKFSTYATKCIMLKLKDYIKRDYVIKPKLTGEGKGKVYAPPVVSISNIVYEDADDKPIKGEDIILASNENWEDIDMNIELDLLVMDGILDRIELEIFLDATLNKYTVKELSKKYNKKKEEISNIISDVRTTLQENFSYNYFKGG